MKKSALRLFPAVCLCLLLGVMLSHSGCVLEGARSGLLLWYNSVVPALFPFMVLSGMIVASGGISVLTAPFYLILRPLLGLSRPGCYALIAGLLCGYPMGAKTCADFVREGRISPAEGRFLMAVCNHPSPMFLLGFAYPLIRETTPLPVFLAAVYGPVAIIAAAAKAVYPFQPPQNRGGERVQNRARRGRAENLTHALPGRAVSGSAAHALSGRAVSGSAAHAPAGLDETIMSAFDILLKIGGYLVIFSILIAFLLHAKSIPAAVRLPLIGVMEMTTGVKQLSSLIPAPCSGAAVCACLAFGGISGVFQTRAVLRDCEGPRTETPAARGAGDGLEPERKKAGLSIRHYVLWKLLHSICSFFLYLSLSSLLPASPRPLL